MNQSSLSKAFQEIATTRKKLRKDSIHPRYPDSIKKLVKNLVNDGVKPQNIADATGVSFSAISKWSRNTPAVRQDVRVLPVVADQESDHSEAVGQKPVLVLKTRAMEISVFSQET